MSKQIKNIIAAGLVIAASSANAATISGGTSTLGLTGADLFNEALPADTLSYFDSDLGTLTGIGITYQIAVNSTGSVTNTSSSAFAFPIHTGAANGVLLQDQFTNVLENSNYIESISSPLFASASSTLDFSVTIPSGFLGLGALSVYEQTGGGALGAGWFDLSGIGASTLTGANISGSVSTNLGATVSIEYTYDANATVPEPTTIILMGLGLSLAGLQSAARRKTKVQSENC